MHMYFIITGAVGTHHNTNLAVPFTSCYAHILPTCSNLQLAAEKDGKEKEPWAALPSPLFGAKFPAHVAGRSRKVVESEGMRQGSLLPCFLEHCGLFLHWEQFWLNVLQGHLPLRAQPLRADYALPASVVGIRHLSRSHAANLCARTPTPRGPPESCGLGHHEPYVQNQPRSARLRCPIGLPYKTQDRR